MCHVQRVTNTCGHRNDHVSLCCRFAKAGYSLAVPISDPNSNLSYPTTSITTMTTDFTSTTTTTTATGDDKSSMHYHSHSVHQNTVEGAGDGDPPAAATAAITASAVAHRGFHACTQPYCIYASVRMLESPVGFMCMVDGCGRAD